MRSLTFHIFIASTLKFLQRLCKTETENVITHSKEWECETTINLKLDIEDSVQQS